MIFATGSTYSQGTPTPDWMAPVMGVVIGLAIIIGIVAAIFGIKAHIQGNDVRRSLYTDEVVDSHQIMMMNDYMSTKVNDLYKALLSPG